MNKRESNLPGTIHKKSQVRSWEDPSIRGFNNESYDHFQALAKEMGKLATNLENVRKIIKAQRNGFIHSEGRSEH